MELGSLLTYSIIVILLVTILVKLYVFGLMKLENKFTEFANNAKSLSVLMMKEVEEKYGRIIQLEILEVVNNFEGRFVKIMNDIDDCKVQLNDIAISMIDIEKKQNQLIDLKTNVEDLSRLNDQLTKKQSQLMDNLVDYQHKTDDVLKRLHGLDTDMAMLYDMLNVKAKALEEKTSMLETNISKCEESVAKLKTGMDNYESMIEKYRNEERHTVTEMKRKIEYLIQNIGKPTLKWESFVLVDEIIRREVEKLEKKYCIVSFHPDTHHRHMRMVGVCVEGRQRERNYEESDFIVTSHKSIPNIPYVMVTLVFIDSNKQGQILETPGQDSNDIKLLTVQASRKKSNDVFVIYVGDEESRSLMPGLLFNPHLKTVTEHFELKQLEQKDRVLTVHERFTITQREKISEAIA